MPMIYINNLLKNSEGTPQKSRMILGESNYVTGDSDKDRSPIHFLSCGTNHTSSVLSVNPKCKYARCVAIRPRGVRCKKPC